MVNQTRILWRSDPDEEWQISTDDGPLPKKEVIALRDHFTRLGIPYRLAGGQILVAPSVSHEIVFPAVEEFYKGRADVLPF